MSDKKTPAKKRKPRISLPPLPFGDTVALLHLPMDAEATGDLATRLARFKADLVEWKAAAKKQAAAGKEITPFPKSKMLKLNKGRLTSAAYDTLKAAYNGGEDISVPPVYNPVAIDAARAVGCPHVRKATAKTPPKDWDEKVCGPYVDDKGNRLQPKNWNEKKFGPWFLKDASGKRTIPSCLYISTEPARSCHTTNILKGVDPANVVTLDSGPAAGRYVVGNGKAADSAPYQISAHSGGNYGAIYDVRRRMSLAGIPGLANLVALVNDAPNCGGAVKLVIDESTDVCFMPGQTVSWGYLMKGDKQLTPAQIAKSDGSEVRFVEADLISGKRIPWVDAWKEIERELGRGGKKLLRERPSNHGNDGGTPQEKSIVNHDVQLRVSTDDGHPFGIKSVALGLMPCKQVTGKKKTEFTISLVIGARTNFTENVGKREFSADDTVDSVDDLTPEMAEDVIAGEEALINS